MGFLKNSLQLDAFNYGCSFEQYLVLKENEHGAFAAQALQQLQHLMRGAFNNYLEYALDYSHAGLFEEAMQLLQAYLSEKAEQSINPLACYYLGWLCLKAAKEDQAKVWFEQAAAAAPDYCFPSKVEDVTVLQAAITHNPTDAKAPYYLGNFWYANGQYEEAIACWEQSIAGDPHFPTPHRNLSLAYHNKRHNMEKATVALQTAFSLNAQDARVLMELDQLYKLDNQCHWERLQRLEDHIALVEQRDDLYLERITLYNLLGDFETARALLAEHKFHPWEGGEGKVVSQFLLCHTELAKGALLHGDYAAALQLLAATEKYPHNLGEGKLPGTPENDIHYLQGLAYNKLGAEAEAQALFRKATEGVAEPVQAIFYNDPQPDKIFYQGLAWIKLGHTEKAERIFNRLIQFANEHERDEIRIDYFAVSLPDLLVFDQDLNRKNKTHCQYLTGLGLLGLNRKQEAEVAFRKVLAEDHNHQGAITHLNMISFLDQHEH